MQYSHSRVELFETCPYRYGLRYLDKLKTLPDDAPANALYLGLALHEGAEKGVAAGVKKYFDSYPVINDLHINEAIKLEHWIPKLKDVIDELCEGETPIFERKIDHEDLVGYMDLLIPCGDNKFKLYDFKYSNHVDRYLNSRQLHEYKYFFEKTNPYCEIVEMGFIFIPKTSIRQKKDEELHEFRKRLIETLDEMQIRVEKVNFNIDKVLDFYVLIKHINEAKTFEKREGQLCNFCEFREFCSEGEDYMILPKNEKRNINVASRKKLWVYGAPFSGKTTLADAFPNAIMLNTDGNLNSFTSPVVEIKETLEGRQTIPAWDNFKATITELQKGSDFETIVVDLVEDTYEHCRRWCYAKLGIEHESDNSFKAYDFVRSEFLTVFKRLMTLDYNIVLISHEDLSKDIMKKSGDKITSVRPNINEKVANKIAGMVDIVARAVADGETRTLQFKADDVVFGGGRLKLNQTVIPLNYDALCSVYNDQGRKIHSEAVENVTNEPEKTAENVTTERSRRRRTVSE